MVGNHVEELELDGRGFRFELCRKPERMGPVPVDHWWMDARRLYAQRGRTAALWTVVIEYFWALCGHHKTEAEPAVQESYILANLLPLARSNAARRIFLDARLGTGGSRTPRVEIDDELERSLCRTRDQALTITRFNQRTADALGPPVLGPDALNFYTSFTDEFLGKARAALVAAGADAGREVAVRLWKGALRRWGVRGGFDIQKQVLNVLSYECRAALHRCYSATWSELLPHLVERHGLDAPSLDFLRLWHLDQVHEAEQDLPAWFHLFHGHVFALHPVGGDLLRTPTGRELVGAWLAGPDRPAAFGSLLHALYLACHLYTQRRDVTAEDRRKRPLEIGGARELARTEGEITEGRARRRPRKRGTDAR